jgi:hypothetical protein
MDGSKPGEVSAASKEVATELFSRSAYLLFSALTIILAAGVLAASPLSPWQKLRAGFPIIQVAAVGFHIRQVWTMRPLDFLNSKRVTMSLAVFTAATLGPFGLVLYFIIFTPRNSEEIGGGLFLAAMSLLFFSYGIVLIVSPKTAFKLDYVEPRYSKGYRERNFDRGVWLMIGVFLVSIGYLCAWGAIKLIQEALST